MICVGAGKGGVGKSTVALLLALALRSEGRVGLFDFDLYGPNIPAMMGIEHHSWTREWTLAQRRQAIRFVPVVRRDLHVVSIGFVLGEDQPLGVDPASAAMIARQLLEQVAWPELDYLVVDLPPGTSAVQHTLVRLLRPDGAVVVVTPQTVAHIDARKAVQMFRHLRVPVLGAVENMSDAACPHCGQRVQLFAPAPHDRSVWALGVDRLARIPFGLTPPQDGAVDLGPEVMKSFAPLAGEVVARLARPAGAGP